MQVMSLIGDNRRREWWGEPGARWGDCEVGMDCTLNREKRFINHTAGLSFSFIIVGEIYFTVGEYSAMS